jgi:hypothetical protein
VPDKDDQQGRAAGAAAVTKRWTEQRVHGAIWTLNYIIDLARLTAIGADAVTGLLLPKFVMLSALDPLTFRSIVQVMDPDE